MHKGLWSHTFSFFSHGLLLFFIRILIILSLMARFHTCILHQRRIYMRRVHYILIRSMTASFFSHNRLLPHRLPLLLPHLFLRINIQMRLRNITRYSIDMRVIYFIKALLLYWVIEVRLLQLRVHILL